MTTDKLERQIAWFGTLLDLAKFAHVAAISSGRVGPAAMIVASILPIISDEIDRLKASMTAELDAHDAILMERCASSASEVTNRLRESLERASRYVETGVQP